MSTAKIIDEIAGLIYNSCINEEVPVGPYDGHNLKAANCFAEKVFYELDRQGVDLQYK